MAFISFENVNKEYGTGDNLVQALKDASFSLERGELAVILGSSGAGKTTALNILGGMDNATRGRVFFDGNDITHWNETQLCQYRRTDVGFVFQFYNLVPNLTALENVELAAQICPDSLDAAQTLQKWASPSGRTIFRRSFPEANSNACRLPVRLLKNRSCCCATSPQGPLIM